MTQNRKIYSIKGMHCESCEVLVERKFKKIDGVEKVKVNHLTGKAEVYYSKEPNLNQLNNLVEPDGYYVAHWSDKQNTKENPIHKNTNEDYIQMGGIFLVIIAAYYLMKQFDLVPNIAITDHMSYGIIFIIGLFAAVSSCIAVVGGLLLALAGKYNEMHPGLTGIQKFKPHIYFNIGRIIGYTGFGAAVGALGSVLTLSPRSNGYLMVFVSIVMLMLGFQLLHLFPKFRKLGPKMPKFISHKIHDLSTTDSKGAPFTLGALSFFLPCGFTQALQLYVLSTGDPKVGALTMLTFSLGTMPALVSLSAISSFTKGKFQKRFLRFAGVLIVLLALFNINNGLTLAGYNLNFASAFTSDSGNNTDNTVQAPLVQGKQVVKMKVNGYGYSPNQFTVVEGVPVEWQIDGGGAAGCGKVLVMPTLGFSKYLAPQGITTITFTPTQTGKIPFNCGMGMMTAGSEFKVIPNSLAQPCDPKTTSCPGIKDL